MEPQNNLNQQSNIGDLNLPPIESVENKQEVQGPNKMINYLVIGIVLAVIITVAGIAAMVIKNKAILKRQKAVSEEAVSTKREKTIPTSTTSEDLQKKDEAVQQKGEKEVVVPTISEDTSIDTLEKEINSFNLDNLDSEDSQIQQDLNQL